MAGIYIHIPFCKQACHYCNFHFSTSLKYKNEMLASILHEFDLRKNYLSSPKIDSVYFGGGTPSLLEAAEIEQILNKITSIYTLSDDAEITLEANPDDLTEKKLKDLQQTAINRLSIGIQSFIQADLSLMNRAHDTKQAINCVEMAHKTGFHNLSIDLIYGTPTLSNEAWKMNLKRAFEFDITHISAYCLTVEEKTALAHFVKVGKVPAVDEEKAAEQFEILVSETTKNDYEHYEISNFCKPNFRAKHNSSYWLGKEYIGIGPSAHSFCGTSRQWNIANNAAYMKGIKNNILPAEIEELNIKERFNEYIMTSLRTNWGCNLEKVARDFGENYVSYLKKERKMFFQEKLMKNEKEVLILTTKGKFIADGIISDLFMV